jgi:hypothetical protein
LWQKPKNRCNFLLSFYVNFSTPLMEHSYELPLDRPLIRKQVSGASGCYGVFSADGKCLYIGRAECLRLRVLAHYIDQRDGNGTQWRLGGASEWYVTKPFAEAGCVLRIWESEDFSVLEMDLILKLNPVHNGTRYRWRNKVNQPPVEAESLTDG